MKRDTKIIIICYVVAVAIGVAVAFLLPHYPPWVAYLLLSIFAPAVLVIILSGIAILLWGETATEIKKYQKEIKEQQKELREKCKLRENMQKEYVLQKTGLEESFKVVL